MLSNGFLGISSCTCSVYELLMIWGEFDTQFLDPPQFILCSGMFLFNFWLFFFVATFYKTTYFALFFRQLESLLKGQAGQMWSSLVSISFLGRGFYLLWWALGAFILLVFTFWPECVAVISRMVSPIWAILLRLESEPTWGALKNLDIESTYQTNCIRTSGCGT